MTNFVRYFALSFIVLATFCISCADNVIIEDETESADVSTQTQMSDLSKMVLTGKDDYRKIFYIQTVNRNSMAKRDLGSVQVIKDVDNFIPEYEEMKIAGICDDYLVIQAGNFNYFSDDDESKNSYALMVYDINSFDVKKPLFQKEFVGFPGTAFYTIGNNIYIGCKNAVRLAKIEKNNITVSNIHDLGVLQKLKTIDVFGRMGNYLLAIDDVIHPYYAFLFDIHDLDNPVYVKTLDLPTDINIHYEDAACKGNMAYVLASYGHMGGYGNHIFGLKYENGKLRNKFAYSAGKSSTTIEDNSFDGHFFPNLNDLFIYGDKLFTTGSGGILILNRNPELKKSSNSKENTFYSELNESYLNAPYAKDNQVKLFKFEKGFITSIAVIGIKIYAISREYYNPPEIYDFDEDKYDIKSVKLLELRYDSETESFREIKSVEVDKHISQIYINK